MAKPRLSRNNQIAPQLRELRALTGMTGVVDPAQAFNLKCWGWGAFPHVNHRQLEVVVDPEKMSVLYRWAKAGRPPKDLPRRVAAVVSGVRQLFGVEWRVRIEGEGKLLFDSGRLVSIKKAKDERREELRREIERIGTRLAEKRRPGSA